MIGKRIKKARLTQAGYLEVIYFETEMIADEERTSKVEKSCRWDPHQDLKSCYEALKFHLAVLCKIIPKPKDVAEKAPELDELLVTSFIVGGDGEHAGVTIVGRRNLDNGKILNLITPFTQYNNEHSPYEFGVELEEMIRVCEEEVQEYLAGKCAPIEEERASLQQGELFPREAEKKNDMDFGDGSNDSSLLDQEELSPI